MANDWIILPDTAKEGDTCPVEGCGGVLKLEKC